MDDLISRAAAIDALADYIHNVDKVMGTGHLTADDCKDAAASVFEELPSAQPKQQWIPCSERLPERNQICIVTDETRRCAYEYGLHDETYDEENGWTYLGHKIIAWMPLPEPYAERINDARLNQQTGGKTEGGKGYMGRWGLL